MLVTTCQWTTHCPGYTLEWKQNVLFLKAESRFTKINIKNNIESAIKWRLYVVIQRYTGRFIMSSVITNIYEYNKETKRPTLMEFFTATGKLKRFFFFTTRDVRCVHHGWHGTHQYDIQVVATHASTRWRVCGKNLNSVPCHPWCTHRTSFLLRLLLLLPPPIALRPFQFRLGLPYEYTRVGTLIVATIYLQLIQNRYMFRTFTLLQCSHQHYVQPVVSDVEVVGYL